MGRRVASFGAGTARTIGDGPIGETPFRMVAGRAWVDGARDDPWPWRRSTGTAVRPAPPRRRPALAPGGGAGPGRRVRPAGDGPVRRVARVGPVDHRLLHRPPLPGHRPGGSVVHPAGLDAGRPPGRSGRGARRRPPLPPPGSRHAGGRGRPWPRRVDGQAAGGPGTPAVRHPPRVRDRVLLPQRPRPGRRRHLGLHPDDHRALHPPPLGLVGAQRPRLDPSSAWWPGAGCGSASTGPPTSWPACWSPWCSSPGPRPSSSSATPPDPSLLPPPVQDRPGRKWWTTAGPRCS